MRNSFKYAHILILFLGLCSITACRKKELSSTVDQNKIYQLLSLTYDYQTNRTSALARFYLNDINGSRLEMSQNSKVFYGSTQLISTVNRGTNYSHVFNGYVSGLNFDWNDTENRHFINRADLPAPIYAVTQSTNSWSSSFGYDLEFDGDSIGVNEEVYLKLEVNQDTSFSIDVTETTRGRTFVHIPSWEIEKLRTYSPSFYLIRRRYKNLTQQTSAGGRLDTEYISNSGILYVW
jgi:hypothetical protein